MNKTLYCPFAIYPTPDDGPRGDRKYIGIIQIQKIYEPIPARYLNINTAT